jgi:hypothetical protein
VEHSSAWESRGATFPCIPPPRSCPCFSPAPFLSCAPSIPPSGLGCKSGQNGPNTASFGLSAHIIGLVSKAHIWKNSFVNARAPSCVQPSLSVFQHVPPKCFAGELEVLHHTACIGRCFRSTLSSRRGGFCGCATVCAEMVVSRCVHSSRIALSCYWATFQCPMTMRGCVC